MKAIAGIGAVVVAAAIVIGGWQLGGSLETSPTNRTAVTHEDSSAQLSTAPLSTAPLSTAPLSTAPLSTAPPSTAPPSSAAQLQSLISAIGQIDAQLEMNISQTERATITPQETTLVHQACHIAASTTPPLPPTVAAFVASNC